MSVSLDPVNPEYAGMVMSVSVIRSTPGQPLYRHLAPIRGLPPDRQYTIVVVLHHIVYGPVTILVNVHISYKSIPNAQSAIVNVHKCEQPGC